jgi:hypothetical protein
MKMTNFDRFKLWFFRDLTDEQRLKLFSLYEIPHGGDMHHSIQLLFLKQICEVKDN